MIRESSIRSSGLGRFEEAKILPQTLATLLSMAGSYHMTVARSASLGCPFRGSSYGISWKGTMARMHIRIWLEHYKMALRNMQIWIWTYVWTMKVAISITFRIMLPDTTNSLARFLRCFDLGDVCNFFESFASSIFRP